MAATTPAAGAAAYTNSSSVFDASGCWSGHGTCSNLGAAGQSGGIATCSGGGFVNQAGFLHTFWMRGDLDRDQDGLPDEADPDNDGDGLDDTVELAGTAFAPTTPTLVNNLDSDGDGADDGAEAVAGTSPIDAGMQLKITSIAHDPVAGATVSWLARSNKTYRVWSAGQLRTAGSFTTLAGQTTAVGPAPAPWYHLEHSWTDTDALTTNRRFYVIEVLP